MSATASLNLPRPFGPYELARQIAVGGMAEVFLARARSVAGFEKIVALKMIHPQFSEDPEFARLLVEEANITAQLSHRNIVQVIDLGQIDETHFIAMEYVDGLDLSRLLTRMRERRNKLSPRFAAFVVREICDGLDHAHRKADSGGKPLKIIHRDVSPPNILISTGGEVKLTRFRHFPRRRLCALVRRKPVWSKASTVTWRPSKRRAKRSTRALTSLQQVVFCTSWQLVRRCTSTLRCRFCSSA